MFGFKKKKENGNQEQKKSLRTYIDSFMFSQRLEVDIVDIDIIDNNNASLTITITAAKPAVLIGKGGAISKRLSQGLCIFFDTNVLLKIN